MDTAAMVTAITTLAGVIAHLWNQQVKQHEDTVRKLDKCEEGHKEGNQRLLNLSVEVAELRGHQAGISDLARSVLDVVNQNRQLPPEPANRPQ